MNISTVAFGRLMQTLVSTAKSNTLATAYNRSSVPAASQDSENNDDSVGDRSLFGSTSTSSTLELLGLIPSDYDGGYLIADNSSVFLNDYDAPTTNGGGDTNENEKSVLTASQYTAPFLYIAFMLAMYVLISLIVFLSALYSHRKHVGYNYDDSLNEESFSSSDEQPRQQQQEAQSQTQQLESHVIYTNQNERTDNQSVSAFSAACDATFSSIKKKKKKKRNTRVRHRHVPQPTAIHRRCGALKRKLNTVMINAKVSRNGCSSWSPKVGSIDNRHCSFKIENNLQPYGEQESCCSTTEKKRSMLARIYNLVYRRSLTSNENKYAKLKTRDEQEDNEM
jgi:hypothetical protein